MKKLLITLGIVLFCVIPFYNNVHTHSGGLDQNGGHHDRKNGGYHYHRPRTRTITPTPTIPKVNTTVGKTQGDMPYTPTKLEWLALQLNILAGYQTENIDIDYIEVKNKDTIVIHIGYSPNTSAEILTLAEKASKDAVRRLAKLYGWDNWVKIDLQKNVVR